ncbi:MAG: glycosyltransferase [Streptococcus alactolyticus]|uniref:Glycosyltransferase n=2 Tax=Streptococcus TaxID=1301 RepID=A0ABY7LYP6_STRAY|nr:PilZ domain-containing protein [Streptococcus alactolyticus]MDY5187539.1 glycosyltransferase [Streptococcus alactolyticus]WBB06698.1 glycosyltransferase [Streptococcus alactolyticus]
MKISQKLLYLGAFVTSLFYLSWRLIMTIPWHDSWFALIFGVLLWGSELVSSITAFIIISNKHKDFKLEKPEIAPERYPDVDVLIATHNEDPDLLYKTVNACTYMHYPDKSKVHIYVCDDTDRPEVAALAKELGVGYFGLSDNKDAKSGNYNNALNQTSSPLVATFDADMIPYSEFLLETVPYFVEQVEADANDEELDKAPIGLIQTPQSFYNEDIFQYHLFSEGTLPNEQDFFSKGINNFNSACGSAFYTGSNTVLYRKAIDDAGGFPTDTITEDFELGARMNIEGYVNYSTDAPMASGLTRLAMRDVSKEYRTQIWGEIVETIFAPYLTIPFLLEAFGISEKKFKVTKKVSDNSWTLRLYALPYIILWSLSVYGLIRFNYGKFGSELFYGSVISFWLIHHIINLTFAIFCAVGRPSYRAFVRFPVDETINIKVDGWAYQVHVADISETGISFKTDLALYLPKDKDITLYLKSQDYKAKAKGRVVRVISDENEWLYGLHFVSVPESEKREFYQYIYDRINYNLPQVQDTWMSVWDDLLENILRRLPVERREATPYDRMTLPKVNVNETVHIGKEAYKLQYSNYYYMTFVGKLKQDTDEEQELTFDYKGMDVKLDFVSYDKEANKSLYQVTNLASLAKTPQFKQLASEWKGQVA